MSEVTFEVPANWTRADLDTFITYVQTNPIEVLSKSPEQHCWRERPCQFWILEGPQIYDGHCGLFSCECTTAVGNRKKPPRWMAKET